MERIVIPFLWEFELRVKVVPGNGDCFFHALLAGYSKSYNLPETDKRQKARILRREIANFLTSRVDDGDIVYNHLSGGNLPSFGKVDPKYTLNGMYNLINSNKFVGTEVCEISSLYTDKNIFIINLNEMDVQIVGGIEDWYREDRTCLVLLYEAAFVPPSGTAADPSGGLGTGIDLGGHYNLCMVRHSDGTIVSHLLHSHKLIRALIERYTYRVVNKI
jgi:hypothetical protein